MSATEFSDALGLRLRKFNSLSAKDSSIIAHAKAAVVQEFIVRSVTIDWAQKNQLFVRKEDVDSEVKKIRNGYPDDIAFRKSLADEGLTYAAWEDLLRFTLLERLVVSKLGEKIKNPTDNEIKNYFENNKSLFQSPAKIKLRQVVTETEEAANQIRKQILSGRDLPSLAKKFSISADASIGGDMGWLEKNSAEFYDALSRLAIGTKSKIIKTAFGYHIFEILDKKPAKLLSVDEARVKIIHLLRAQAEQVIYSGWLESQVVQSRVFKDDNFIDQIQVQTRSLR